MSIKPATSRGPFRADSLKSGAPYELSRGHPIYCAPTGADDTGPNGLGFAVLSSDPAVERAWVDPGIKLSDDTLRAPDVGVGLGPEKPGWGTVAPTLAVEFASREQDERDLQTKIVELHAAGTRWVWVLRLSGPRRVEVYEKGQPVQSFTPGQRLLAPGVLQNPVPVEALYDRDAAHEATLHNLLQRKGYDSLDAVRDQGRQEGRQEGLREGDLHARRDAVRAVLLARGATLSDARAAVLDACTDPAALGRWLALAATAPDPGEVLGR
ncbi:MAG: Uma2 family endonuclease [Deltaproteobacteria bacterium]|nr:Uma2 family endonuclease [Deltaproteobacteria bacterium]